MNDRRHALDDEFDLIIKLLDRFISLSVFMVIEKLQTITLPEDEYFDRRLDFGWLISLFLLSSLWAGNISIQIDVIKELFVCGFILSVSTFLAFVCASRS